MKRYLPILTIVIFCSTSTGHAQTKLAEDWTTYCDNGVEKVRVSFTYYLAAVGFVPPHSEWLGAYRAACDTLCEDGPDNLQAELKPLGNDQYKWTWQGWSRDCFGAQVWREARMSFVTEGDSGPENRVYFVDCDDGPQTIVDLVDCSLPVETSTWGAIKALYR